MQGKKSPGPTTERVTMANGRVLGSYITICVIAFIISKIVIAILLYKRWSRKQKVFQDSFSGKHNERIILGWDTRYKIAVGAARGLAYLHHNCIPHIIHRDIKSSNILLDKDMEAHVSDFGLATLLGQNQTHVSTFVAGTFGYLAPEYFDTGRATAKGDVYSFGVVLLELLTGKRPTDETFIEEGKKLVTWVKAVVEYKREELVIDSSLEHFPDNGVEEVFSIAMRCLETDPSLRPTMAEVLKMLEQIGSDKNVSDI
ncbi:receptor-like serine/threonine-protein kinase At1g78530 [Aristolochia californica]|uniref:receptor-like serine/threonine-protein kinase At1g78530 n=1 Tax=Aristolochia californica TaxID=171875 RepID=UPI0035D71107